MDNNIEVWKDICEYEGCYEISNLGQVRSLDRVVKHWRGGSKIIRGRTLVQINRKDYLCVNLCLDKKIKICSVHRLVAIHFIENKNNDPIINHKDGNKLNNHVDNLEWCTVSYNVKHAFNTGLIIKKYGENNSQATLTVKDVIEIRNVRGVGYKILSKKFKVSKATISNIKNNITWKGI